MKPTKSNRKVLIWMCLLFLLNILLINIAITKNYESLTPLTTISHDIFQENIASKFTLLISESLNTLLSIRIFLTTISLLGIVAIMRLVHLIAGKRAGLIAGLLYSVSPPALYFMSTINPLAIIITLILLGLFFFLTTPFIGKILGSLLLAISALLSPSALLIVGVVFIFNIIYKERFRKTKIFLGILLIGSLIVWYLFTNFELYFPIFSPENLMEVAFEFGNIFGIYIITFIYGAIGLFSSRIKKYKKVLVIMLLGSIFLLFQSLYYLIFTNILLCIFASIALRDSFGKTWNINNAKIATICAVIAVLTLSTVTFFNVLETITPDAALAKEAKSILEEYPLQNLSTHPYYMSLLQYISAREKESKWFDFNLTICPGVPNLGERRNLKDLIMSWNNTKECDNKTLSDLHKIYYSRELDGTLNAARELGIKYILITKEMREGLVWKYDEEGLLFLLRNKEVFKVKKINDEVELIEINV